MIRKFGWKQIEISPCGQSGCEDVGCVIFWRERHTLRRDGGRRREPFEGCGCELVNSYPFRSFSGDVICSERHLRPAMLASRVIHV